MKVLVLNNLGSFSLVSYLTERLGTGNVFSMARIDNGNMWNIFKGVAPDVVFVDFCNENAVNLTNRVKELTPRPKIVIRLHGYEAQSWFINKIDWSVVSSLVVVSPKFKEIMASKNVVSLDKIHIVSNGVDLQRFRLQDESGINDNAIAYIGYLNKKKGPTLLRTVMASMPDRHFYIGGTHQDEQVRLYLDDLKLENVTYYGWVQAEEFLKGKRFVLSTSVTESFGMGIAEGMAMGLTPLVHAWPGADKIWPSECIWRTFDELKAISSKEPAWCRKWIEDRYPINTCVDKILDLLQ